MTRMIQMIQMTRMIQMIRMTKKYRKNKRVVQEVSSLLLLTEREKFAKCMVI